MNYLCSECSIELSKWEMFLNAKYGLGKLYCEFCNSKKEREAIKKIVEIETSMHDDYTLDLLGDSIPQPISKGDNNESN